jgi:exonuclease SbcC
MLQSPEIESLPSALRETLTALVPDVSLTETILKDDCLPVVLMVSGHAVHAFAVGEERDYGPLYESFKKHYLGRGPEWAAKDVSFVFCLPAGQDVDETFTSKVEVDVYFCRKYVIQFGESLEASLARLPFLPLAPISGAPIRPPSAKTLLRQRSMKTDLANSLIEPGTGAGTIFTNCLNGRYGPTHAIDERSESAIAIKGEQREQATLKSISIENFRAYRKKKDFELGSAITVLYGPNGFGKTSFFDAVDFVVTGGVGRLERPNGGLSKVAKHLDSKDEPTQVSLTFERAGKTHVISRNLIAPNEATLDGKVANRKLILSSLTGGEFASADRVENLVSLFRATHLFSQDRQELTGSVADDCALPADIVSRMLAFEDYVNGLKKVNEVLKLAKQEHERSTAQVRKARQDIDKDVDEIKRLEGLLDAVTSPDALNGSFNELEKAIANAGIDLNGVSARDTRALRASLDAAAAEASSRRTRLDKCLKDVTNVRSLSEQLEPLRRQVDETRVLAEKADAAVTDAANRVTTATNEVALRKSQEDQAKNLRDWFSWAVTVQPENARLTAECQVHSSRLAALVELLGGQRESLSRAELALGEAEAAVRSGEERAAAESSKRVRIQRAAAMLEVANSVSPRLVEVQSSETQVQKDVNRLQGKLRELDEVVLAQRLVVVRVERQLGRARSDADKLKGVLAELRSYVQGSECLLCGHDHGSPQELLTAIDQRMEQADLVVQLSESVTTEREKQRNLEQQQQVHKDALSQAEQRLTAAGLQREELERQLAECHKAFGDVGLAIGDALASQLADAIVQAFEDERKALAAVNVTKESLLAAQSNLSKARQTYDSAENERKSLSKSLDDAKRRLDEIHNDARRGAVNLSVDLETLQGALREQEATLAQASDAHQIANTARETQLAAQSAVAGMAIAARAAHQAALQGWNRYQGDFQSNIVALAAEGLVAETTEEQVLMLMKEAEARASTAIGLRNRAAELEVAADAAATSAAFQSIRARIDANESVAKQAEAHASLVEPWVKYFEGVSKLLSGQQAMATEHFTTEYGPRTEVIQRRLRPVYGFQDVKVTSKDSSIKIHVRRNGEELRPTDFFSQSQVQTLVLGLFLTACSSQTWSGFSSIMMDDPVTHFDNLNTYALLDLLSGLQSSSEGDRQFVISTCDEKLLQLARHKFRHLGDAAKFYRFSAIGAEGPMVAEIPA